MMIFSTKTRLSISAFTVAAVAFIVLHGSVLVGFEHPASKTQNSVENGSHLAKAGSSPRTLVLERVVISTRRA